MSLYHDLVRLLDHMQGQLAEREERVMELERELERSRQHVDSYLIDMLADRLALSRACVLRALEQLDMMDYTSEQINALTEAFVRLALEEANDER